MVSKSCFLLKQHIRNCKLRAVSAEWRKQGREMMIVKIRGRKIRENLLELCMRLWYNVREGKARNQERGSAEIRISFPALPLS